MNSGAQCEENALPTRTTVGDAMPRTRDINSGTGLICSWISSNPAGFNGRYAHPNQCGLSGGLPFIGDVPPPS
ncbi:unannotated protein [freshwater metagenome]|uniref:Unannotated protein n=1 Tax=freshwater metagenome TaxID=449393 RepID=A0A6J5YLH4_9ZZZZ